MIFIKYRNKHQNFWYLFLYLIFDYINSKIDSKIIKIAKQSVTITVGSGYGEYGVSFNNVNGSVVARIPFLESYQYSDQRPTWALNNNYFWINSKRTGYMRFVIYTFYI